MTSTDLASVSPDIDYIYRFPQTELNKSLANDANSGQLRTIDFIGSSDCDDLQQDVVSLRGLKALALAPVRTVTLIEHEMRFGNLLGKLIELPHIVTMPPNDFGIKRASGPYNGLQLKTEIDDTNPEALRIHTLAKRDYPVGFSVGMLLPEGSYEPRKDKDGRVVGLEINDPIPLEWSATLCPANCQSWAISAKSLLVSKGILSAADGRENAYRIKHLDDFAPADVVTLRRLSAVLHRYGISTNLCDGACSHAGCREAA